MEQVIAKCESMKAAERIVLFVARVGGYQVSQAGEYPVFSKGRETLTIRRDGENYLIIASDGQ